jgi:hypothetical protein
MYSWFLITQLGSDSVKELFEIHLSTEAFKVSNHIENGRIFALEAKALHGWLELSGINLAGGFSVEEVEGFSEFFDFVLGESWALDFLFSGSFDSWFWSAGHLNKS